MDATQVKPPLKLLRRHSVIPAEFRGEEPPSFCMEPYNMKLDLYAVADEDVDIQDEVVLKAPVQNGVHMLQPAYEKCLSFIYDVKQHRIWTRSCTATTGAVGLWKYEELRKEFEKYKFPDSARWLHCLRVTALHPKSDLEFCIIVADIMDSEMPHYARREALERTKLPQLGIKKKPDTATVHLIPEFNEATGGDLWAAMHLQNQEWQNPFFKGIISKEADGKYIFQKEEVYKPDLCWQLHEFDNLF